MSSWLPTELVNHKVFVNFSGCTVNHWTEGRSLWDTSLAHLTSKVNALVLFCWAVFIRTYNGFHYLDLICILLWTLISILFSIHPKCCSRNSYLLFFWTVLNVGSGWCEWMGWSFNPLAQEGKCWCLDSFLNFFQQICYNFQLLLILSSTWRQKKRPQLRTNSITILQYNPQTLWEQKMLTPKDQTLSPYLTSYLHAAVSTESCWE